ncbi:MAG: Hsp20/alpha crystallin family protein [Gammaproteobacteria bacterium]
MNLVPRRSLFDFDDLFDLWGPLRTADATAGAFSPRVDVKELDDHYEITAELPGVKKEDLDVSLHDGVLTISAETRQEDVKKDNGKVIRQERRYGKYVRSFNLGGDVAEGDIAAAFKDGILTLTAPKRAPQAPQAKRIKVD